MGNSKGKIQESVEKPCRVNGKRDSKGRWKCTELRICLGCHREMSKDCFSTSGKTASGSIHYRSRCKKCYAEQQSILRDENRDKYREYWRKFHSNHREERNQQLRDYRKKIRQRGLDALGGKCVYCGRTNPKVLTFGHIKNDGNEHRRRMKHPDAVYRDWDKKGWPKDEVELQCYNYNLGGSCD